MSNEKRGFEWGEMRERDEREKERGELEGESGALSRRALLLSRRVGEKEKKRKKKLKTQNSKKNFQIFHLLTQTHTHTHHRDTKSGKCVSEVKNLHSAQITSVSVSVDGATLLTCGRDSALRVSDARSLRPKAAKSAPPPSSNPSSSGPPSSSPCPPMTDPEFVVASVWCSAALGPDAKHAAAASGGGLFVWETDTGKRVRKLVSSSSSSAAAASSSGALAVSWSPQGTPLACCDRGGGVSLWVPRDEAR